MAQIVEHEDEPQMFQEETVTKTQFYEMEGILHKQTGEILTFVEAIRQGLLVSLCCIFSNLISLNLGIVWSINY